MADDKNRENIGVDGRIPQIWGSSALTHRYLVCSHATWRNGMEPQRMTSAGVKVADTTYLPATEVAKHVGISRTTMWRWRQEGKIPLGRRYRNGLILFSPAEVELVRTYADRLEPVSAKGAARPKQQSAVAGRP